MILGIAMLVAGVVATAGAVHLYRSGDPAWRLAGAAALFGFTSGTMALVGPGTWAIFLLPATALATYWVWSFAWGLRRGAR